MISELHARLQEIEPDIIGWRRYLHQHPELSFQETNTAKFVAEKLRSFGIEVKEGVGGNGVLGLLEGREKGVTIAFRADFDALPIRDEKEVDYKSTVEGVMHACGHDGHTSALLGVARVLSEQRDQLKGNVVFIFQHAEEQPPGGAVSIIADGGLDGVDVVFGAHLSSSDPSGVITSRSGALLAAADNFEITVQGKGGHGASPHTTVDSIIVGTQIINQLQQIVSRRISPLTAAVVTVGVFQAGSAVNVIADKARIGGTVRTLDENVRRQIENEIHTIVKGISEASHADFDIQYTHGYPVLYNHDKELAVVQQLVQDQLKDFNYVECEPGLAGEDFAYYLQHKPGAFFFVGAGGEENTYYPHHHPLFDFDERAMVASGQIFLSLAAHYLYRS